MAQHYTAKEMLARLVGFDTESHRSNLALIEFVEDYLSSHGVESTRVYDDTGEKAALYAQIGPAEPGGVILSGHTDVVPVEGQAWSSDPYTLREEGGRLFGRGTADMKGFLAICLAAVPRMQSAGLSRPIQLALSYDEETGCLGAPRMIAAMREALPTAAAAIIGEPTSMKLVTGHKAVVRFDTELRGHEVHSSLLPYGVSAVMEAAELVQWMAQRNEENRGRAAADCPFDPPFTTLHVGTIQGGSAQNITARDCRFPGEIRAVPGESLDDWIAAYRAQAEAVQARMQAVHSDTWVKVTLTTSVPGCRAEEGGAAEALLRKLTGDNDNAVVSYGTEAGQFQEAGYSAAVCGPGSIEQAHQPDEYITLEQLAAGEAFIDRLIGHLSA